MSILDLTFCVISPIVYADGTIVYADGTIVYSVSGRICLQKLHR